MRLNPDCIRDILLTVEETTTYLKGMSYYNRESELYNRYPNTGFEFKRLKKYSHDEIVYHVRQCKMAHLITGVIIADGGDGIKISDLTPNGHEFLANIRSDNLWNNIKNISTTIGANSLTALITISTDVVTQLINHQLGIQ